MVLSAHVHPQRFGNGNRAVLAQVVLQEGNQHPGRGGRITDSQGRTVDFKNAILIMTSNLGSEYILDGIADGEIKPEARDAVDRLLKTRFRPEFLNRIDEIVYYKPLTRNEISAIVRLMTDSLNRRLESRQLKVRLTPAAENAVIDRGFDPVYGARPLKRYLQTLFPEVEKTAKSGGFWVLKATKNE